MYLRALPCPPDPPCTSGCRHVPGPPLHTTCSPVAAAYPGYPPCPLGSRHRHGASRSLHDSPSTLPEPVPMPCGRDDTQRCWATGWCVLMAASEDSRRLSYNGLSHTCLFLTNLTSFQLLFTMMSMKMGPSLGLSRHMAVSKPKKAKASGKLFRAGERKGRKTLVNRERVCSEETFNAPGENITKTLD